MQCIFRQHPRCWHIVGDCACTPTEHSLTPFNAPDTGNCPAKRACNEAISRCRVTMKCALGQTAGKWRILHSPLSTSVDSATRIVKCIARPHDCCANKGHTVPSTPSEDPCKSLPPECCIHNGRALRGKSMLHKKIVKKMADMGIFHK